MKGPCVNQDIKAVSRNRDCLGWPGTSGHPGCLGVLVFLNLKIFLGFFSIDFPFIFNIPSHSRAVLPRITFPVIFQVSELLQSGEKPSLDIVIYFERDFISSSFSHHTDTLYISCLRLTSVWLWTQGRVCPAHCAPHGPNRTPIRELVLNSRLLSDASSTSQHLFCRVNITIFSILDE